MATKYKWSTEMDAKDGFYYVTRDGERQIQIIPTFASESWYEEIAGLLAAFLNEVQNPGDGAADRALEDLGYICAYLELQSGQPYSEAWERLYEFVASLKTVDVLKPQAQVIQRPYGEPEPKS